MFFCISAPLNLVLMGKGLWETKLDHRIVADAKTIEDSLFLFPNLAATRYMYQHPHVRVVVSTASCMGTGVPQGACLYVI
jgi:hypothetical protein